MRKYPFFYIILAIYFLCSCNSDPDESIEPFIGIWAVEQIYLTDGIVNIEIGDTSLVGDFSIEGTDINTIITFNQDYTMSNDGMYQAQTTYNIADQMVRDTVLASDFGGRGTWYVEDENVIIQQDTVFHVLDIKMVASDTMALEFPLDLTIDNDSIVSRYQGTLHYEMVK